MITEMTIEEIEEIKNTLEQIIKTKFGKNVKVEHGLRWPDESESMWFYLKTSDGKNYWIGAYRETCIHHMENVLYSFPKNIITS